MDKLLFIYDDLMTKQKQTLLKIPLHLVTPAQVQAKHYWLNDTKRKRQFIMPEHGVSTKIVYGGVFVLHEYEHFAHKLHSYYNNSIPFTTHTMKEDLFDFTELCVKAINFSSLVDLQRCNYLILREIKCEAFIGNVTSKRIQKSISKRHYYGMKNINAESFKQMIKENYKCRTSTKPEC